MRKLLLIMLIAALLCSTVSAYEAPTDFTGMTLEQIMEDFMQENGLTETNFSISYYNTVTGESYDFCEYKFTMAASTYKLPLNMCFYEMEQAGVIDPNDTYRWTGLTYSQIHEQSILYSNNEVSEALTGYWNNYYIYKENLRKYSDMPTEEIDASFYLTNTSCTGMMIDTLKYLYENSDKFSELIGYMKGAKADEYFRAGVQEYEIAHKYGAINEHCNDVGIVYTPQPFLLAVFTQLGGRGDEVLADVARLLTNYTVWQAGGSISSESLSSDVPAVEEETAEAEAPVTEDEPAVTEEPAVEEEPVVTEEPIAEEEPVVTEEPIAEEEPVETEDPAVEEELAVTEEPVAEEEITVEEEPVITEELSPVEDPFAEGELSVTENVQQELSTQDQTPQAKEAFKEKILWTVIGIVSVLAVLAVPVILRRRW